MATLKIEPANDSTPSVWVSLTRFSDAELARLKKIAGARWNPERKQWQLPDTPTTRAVLAEIVAMPPTSPTPMIPVKPKSATLSQKKLYKRYVPGRDKPLTTNPPHPFIKQVDDELVLLDASSRAQLIVWEYYLPLALLRQEWRTVHAKRTGNICAIILIG